MKKFILTGHPKTGNTWCRFVIFNYWNALENGASETLTYEQLIEINEQLWEGSDEYPLVYFTHVPKNRRSSKGKDWSKQGRIYDETSNIIYVIRNPFDTMISYFHYLTNRDLPFNRKDYNKELMNLEGFVKHFLPNYINHVKSTMEHANIIVKYELMRKDPFRFIFVLSQIYGSINKEIAIKAIEMSSFDKIKEMGIRTGRIGGLATSFRDHFTRDGRVEQYKEVMTPTLIEYIKNECMKEGILNAL